MRRPAVVRDFAQAVEGLGFHYLITADHVVGADPTNRPADSHTMSIYNHKTIVHEPLILFAFLGAVTSRLEFATEIIILPQRQTVLFAKQAAELDYLLGGRLRIGLGLGWNTVEYEALNEDFHTRGRRITEQVEVLRALWTEEVVDYKGRWHRIDRAGLNPLPVQRPIPIWMGGHSEPVLRRTAALADGWMPQFDPNDESSKEAVAMLRRFTREAGREASEVDIEGRTTLSESSPEDWDLELDAWRAMGATHLGVSTRGLSSFDDHIGALVRFKAIAGEFSPA